MKRNTVILLAVAAVVLFLLLGSQNGNGNGQTVTSGNPFADFLSFMGGGEQPSQLRPTAQPQTAAIAADPKLAPATKIAAGSQPRGPRGPSNSTLKAAGGIPAGWYIPTLNAASRPRLQK